MRTFWILNLKLRRTTIAMIGFVLLWHAVTPVRADEKLKDIACRSVHLGFPAPDGVAFYNEVTVEKSAVGSYFMVCGWDAGYFGMQELGNGKKLLLFSVWDSEKNDPNAVAEEQRVKLLQRDEKMRIGRFGGEGSGGQSFFDYDWKIGETYRFMVTAKIADQRTEYSGYFFVPEDKAWKHLVTFSTITRGRPLRGYYSFIEDFKRDRVSATKPRTAYFGPGWVQAQNGEWSPLVRARFTADSNPVTNINAGVKDERFFLATGGETENSGTRLKDFATLPEAAHRKAPADLPAAR